MVLPVPLVLGHKHALPAFSPHRRKGMHLTEKSRIWCSQSHLWRKREEQDMERLKLEITTSFECSGRNQAGIGEGDWGNLSQNFRALIDTTSPCQFFQLPVGALLILDFGRVRHLGGQPAPIILLVLIKTPKDQYFRSEVTQRPIHALYLGWICELLLGSSGFRAENIFYRQILIQVPSLKVILPLKGNCYYTTGVSRSVDGIQDTLYYSLGLWLKLLKKKNNNPTQQDW